MSNTKKTILILGGYGNTGKPLARLLLEYGDSNLHLILAGRNLARAEELAKQLNQEFAGNRVSGKCVDATSSTLAESFRNMDLVLVASSTAAYAKQVASAAMEAGIDYYDIQVSANKVAILKDMAPQVKQAGLCFITDGGFHPGLPAAMIRYLAPDFQQLESARVASVIQFDWAGLETISPSTMDEFVGEFNNFQMSEYKDGTWHESGFMAMMNPPTMDFGEPFGCQYCVPMLLEELKTIPGMYPTISETGFYVGGFNWVVDYVISPVIMLALKIWPRRAIRPMGRLLHWGLRTFSKPPYGTVLKLEARGTGKDGEPLEETLTISHKDAYALTAIPVAATLLQYLSGDIRKPGVWFQATLVDPKRLMLDMNRMGVDIQPRPK